MSELQSIDLLTITASDLQQKLQSFELTSVDLINLYLAQIDKHNHQGLKLNALISIAPYEKLMEEARKRDEERLKSKLRGPLHGIPVVVKDSIITNYSMGMETATCGCLGLVGAKASKNAPVVDELLKAGMIIIGKANLSEMSGCKGEDVTTGWSAVGGQTQTPYVIGGVAQDDTTLGHSTPEGSSSGSAVSIAAGFAPISIGTETDGSIIQPADRSSLYSIKITVGSISTEGTLPWATKVSDSLGPLAKSPEDLANLLGVMMGGKDHSSSLTRSFKGLKLGFLDPALWEWPPSIRPHTEIYTKQFYNAIDEAKERIKAAGGIVKDVTLIQLDQITHNGKDIISQLGKHCGQRETNYFLSNYDEAKVHTLKDIIEYNKAHASEALPPSQPSQSWLIDQLDDKNLSEDEYHELFQIMRQKAKINGIEKVIRDNDLDVIIGSPTGHFSTVVAAAGCPAGSVPLGYADFNGRAFGLMLTAAADREDKILQVMSAWEATFPPRQPPPQMVEFQSKPSPKM